MREARSLPALAPNPNPRNTLAVKKALFAELMASMREVLAHAKKERRKRKRLASARKDDRRTPDRHPPRTI